MLNRQLLDMEIIDSRRDKIIQFLLTYFLSINCNPSLENLIVLQTLIKKKELNNLTVSEPSFEILCYQLTYHDEEKQEPWQGLLDQGSIQ